MAYNSTIKQKPCKGGCGKMPKFGYAGYCGKSCMPEEMQQIPKYNKSRISSLKRQNLNTLSRNIKNYAKDAGAFIEPSKSDYLKKADALFSAFIRNRDADKNGNVMCVCCNKVFNIEAVNASGDKIIQCMHFIDRNVYSLRFDEDNAHAGCGYCNLDMHINKNGIAYRRYLQFMETEYGEAAVAEMSLAHRKINKIELSQLINIIEHYEG